MTAVTLAGKCYVFVCRGCDELAFSNRSDALTCSGRCRVRVARHPDLLAIDRASAAAARVPVAMMVQAAAIARLRPDLLDGIRSGTVRWEDGLQAAWHALWERLRAVMREEGAGV